PGPATMTTPGPGVLRVEPRFPRPDARPLPAGKGTPILFGDGQLADGPPAGLDSRFHVVTEGGMNMLKWNSLIQALVLVRLGQELGTDSRLAKALHDLVEALAFAWR
ncbi:MAG: hypothetical protein EBR23_08790, partial [Planctomycetia bacterium]|nr:hypothetical protein [Planctomycetia bacterium]